MDYNHRKIESKWQEIWDKEKRFKVEINHAKEKYYVLDMFPYPSGSGLHVGHTIGYVSTDVIARFERMRGKNVLHPMGWDSFGLPAEQYAIRTGVHPKETTAKNIATYKRQLKQLGLSYDWDREIATSDPDYYKWTQWIFTKLYEKGLAYEASMLVNYCPTLGTVLANEEVENGKSKEGGYLVERKALRQWILKITAYAEELLEDLDLVDWPESVKKLQRNWIGKSLGHEVAFGDLICFTTRIDTIMGACFVAISPEHPLAEKYCKVQAEDFLARVRSKSDQERTDVNREGDSLFTGSYVPHPITAELLPVFLADYVLMGYGTGAVMGVPAGDERDALLAKRHNLPVVEITPAPQLPEDKVRAKTCYKLRDWLFSRQRYWGEPIPILHYEDGSMRSLTVDELPLLPPELTDYKPAGDGQSPLAKESAWVNIVDPKTGKVARRATNTMPQWAGSCWYYLRFTDPGNHKEAFSCEAEKYWLPVDLYVGGVEHAVLHLLYARFWHKVLYDCHLVTTKEPFLSLRNQGLVTSRSYKIPGGSYVEPEHVLVKGNEYYHKQTGQLLESSIEKMSKSKLNGVSPDQIVDEYGADALRLYALFMGPFDQERIWNIDGVVGCRRFLMRFCMLLDSPKLSDFSDLRAEKLVAKLTYHVSLFIQNFEFNRAVAAFMEFCNDLLPLEKYPKKVVLQALKLLFPFAPHLASEGFEMLGEGGIADDFVYPSAKLSDFEEVCKTYVVQIDGKVRANFVVEGSLPESELIALAQSQEKAQKFLEGKSIQKVVVVKDKLVSFSTI